MSTQDERTSLLSGDAPPRYLFQSTLTRHRHRRVRQFQCCVCAIFLCAIVVVLVFAVSYGINQDLTMASELSPVNSTAVLLTLSWPISDNKQPTVCVKDHEWQSALEFGKEALHERDVIETNAPTIPVDSPSYRHQKAFVTSSRSRSLSRMELLKENAQKYLYKNNKTRSNSCNNSQHMWILNQANSSLTCNMFQKYYSFDGNCNNMDHPLEYGVALTPFRRALPPDYSDGISKPRLAKDGKQLPSARNVSLTVHRPIYRNDNKFTLMLAVWGQFIDHDLTATALTQGTEGAAISCCSINVHPECFPVMIDSNDPYYSNYNVTCIEFIRSAAAPTRSLGPRQQLNQATAFLDGSVMYGSHVTITQQLREFREGKLKMYKAADNRTLLPISTDPTDGCNREEQNKIGRYCFMTGDQRANENLYLTSMHLIWARHHNRLASYLGSINPHWRDEQVFQEARRILIAQLQHITYNEFLKILIDPQLMKKLRLLPRKKGYYKGYDSSVDASIANSFAASAFRFGHTLIPALVKFLKDNSSDPEYVQFHRMLFNPYSLYQPGGLDNSLHGAMNTTVEASDTYFNAEVKSHLFQKPNVSTEATSCGLDLVSLNIQRGRDHGIPSYPNWREHCRLRRPGNFNELVEDIDSESLERIQLIYRYSSFSRVSSRGPVRGARRGCSASGIRAVREKKEEKTKEKRQMKKKMGSFN